VINYRRINRIEELIFNANFEKSGDELEADRLLNVREATRFLGDAVATLYGRTSRNEIPFYKRGKKVYFKKAELLEWVEQGRVRSQVQIVQDAMKVSK